MLTAFKDPPYYQLGPHFSKDQEEWFNEPQLADFYLQEVLTSISHGVGPTGLLLRKRRAMLDWVGMHWLADRMIMEVGDERVFRAGTTGEEIMRISWAIPIAYDVWYLFAAKNIFRFDEKEIDKTIEKLETFFKAVDPMKSMKMEEGKDDILRTDSLSIMLKGVTMPALPNKPEEEIPVGSIVDEGTENFTKGSGIYSGYVGPAGDQFSSLHLEDKLTSHTIQRVGTFIEAAKEMRFELYTPAKGTAAYDSKGPKQRQNDYAGYLSFPIGPLGVHLVISIITQTIAIGENIQSDNVVPVEFSSSDVVIGGDIVPPSIEGHEGCPGVNLIFKAYLIGEDPPAERFIEYLAEDAGEKIKFHKNLRYWIPKDSKWMWPGEFVALICRPMPTHCWFFQETSPFIYSGNWAETEFYTSAIVKEVLEPNEGEVIKDFEPEDGEVGKRYRVWVKNEELILKSSDFLEYEVDDRVALLKQYREEAGGTSCSMGPAGSGTGAPANATWFSWEGLANQKTCDGKDQCDQQEDLNKTWVIVPIIFYSTESGLGGL